MTIPGSLDTQIPLSRFGEETSPITTILKSTMWTLFLKNKTIFIKEYQGQRKSADILSFNVDFYSISDALDNLGQISTTKFWLWSIEGGNLYFTEVEPFQEKAPILGTKMLVKSDVDSGSFKTSTGNIIKGFVISKQTEDFGKEVTYNNYPAGGSVADDTFFVNWPGSRLNQISILVEQGTPEKFIVTYLDTASPPNVNLEEIDEVVGSDFVVSGSVVGSSIVSSKIIRNFIIEVDPTVGEIGDQITITCQELFDPTPESNIVFFGNIIADQVFFIDTSTLNVIVPFGAVSSDIHVEIPIAVSNFVFFEVAYPDEVFDRKKKKTGKFILGPSKAAIYNRDLAITNFSEVVDENSIIQNVYNILLTRPGERILNPGFGCPIHDEVFDLIESQDVSEKKVLSMIEDSLNNFEPRAQLLKDQSFIDFREEDSALDVVLAIRVPSGIIKEIAISVGKGIKSV